MYDNIIEILKKLKYENLTFWFYLNLFHSILLLNLYI